MYWPTTALLKAKSFLGDGGWASFCTISLEGVLSCPLLYLQLTMSAGDPGRLGTIPVIGMK
jgi:hypothetical protein